MIVTIRQAKCYTLMFKDDNGQWFKGHYALANLASIYFRHFFRSNGHCDLSSIGPHPVQIFVTSHTQSDTPFL